MSENKTLLYFTFLVLYTHLFMENIYFVIDTLCGKIVFSFIKYLVTYSFRIVLTLIWRHSYFVNYFFNIPKFLIAKDIVAQTNKKQVFTSRQKTIENNSIYTYINIFLYNFK